MTPGTDYGVKVTSATNSTLTNLSDQPFSIDAPIIDSRSLVHLPDGSFSFSFTAYGSTQVVVAASSNLVNWQDLAFVNLTNGVATFTDTGSFIPMRFYRVQLP